MRRSPPPPTEEGHHREPSGRIGAKSPQTTAERSRVARGVRAGPHGTRREGSHQPPPEPTSTPPW
jgi:hypothetical protein